MSDWVPWAKVGPDRSYLWNWDDENLQKSLKVGMILETYDCGYIRVDEITPEGIVQRESVVGEYTWTWDRLKALECIIYSEAGDEGVSGA